MKYKEKMKIRISLTEAFIWSIYIVFLAPNILEYYIPYFRYISIAIRILGVLVGMMCFLRTKVHSSAIYILIVYIIYIGFVTFFADGSIIQWFSTYANIIGVAMLTEYFVQNRIDHFIIKTGRLLLGGVVLNLVSLLLFPNGLMQIKTTVIFSKDLFQLVPLWVFDSDNRFITWFVPTIVLVSIEDMKRKTQKAFLVTIMATFSLVYTWSAGAMTVFLLFLILYTFGIETKLIKRLNIRAVLMGYIFVWGYLILFEGYRLFQTFIVDVLHKNMTLSGRTIVWQRANAYILRNLFWGNGVLDTNVITGKIGLAHCHSHLLHSIFTGGIIGLIIYLFFWFSVVSPLYKQWNQREARILGLLFICVLIADLIDFLEFSGIYILYIICSNYKYVDNYINEVTYESFTSN